jgi:hypothetical protein
LEWLKRLVATKNRQVLWDNPADLIAAWKSGVNPADY